MFIERTYYFSKPGKQRETLAVRRKACRVQAACRLSMANCYFARPHDMQHCYIPFFMLLISNALLVLARHRSTEPDLS